MCITLWAIATAVFESGRYYRTNVTTNSSRHQDHWRFLLWTSLNHCLRKQKQADTLLSSPTDTLGLYEQFQLHASRPQVWRAPSYGNELSLTEHIRRSWQTKAHVSIASSLRRSLHTSAQSNLQQTLAAWRWMSGWNDTKKQLWPLSVTMLRITNANSTSFFSH